MDWTLFCSIFALIFIAELPDKTAFATLLMATQARPLPVFTGVALAFVVQSAVAVAMGSVIGLLPVLWVHLLAGALFIGFAAYNWFDSNIEEDKAARGEYCERNQFFKAAWKSFIVIFIAEWGDLTQLATASVAARYSHSLSTVFFAATAALWAVTALAVFLGSKLQHTLPTATIKKISTFVFLGVGFYFILNAMRQN